MYAILWSMKQFTLITETTSVHWANGIWHLLFKKTQVLKLKNKLRLLSSQQGWRFPGWSHWGSSFCAAVFPTLSVARVVPSVPFVYSLWCISLWVNGTASRGTKRRSELFTGTERLRQGYSLYCCGALHRSFLFRLTYGQLPSHKPIFSLWYRMKKTFTSLD